MPPKIIVIDNETGMRKVIAKILVPQGYTVLDADDAASGLAFCGKESPDAVLMDIRLPDMDGPDLLAEIKKINPEIPVIVLSGFGDVDSAIELVKAGAYDHLSKPFKVDALVQMLGKALAKTSQVPAMPGEHLNTRVSQPQKPGQPAMKPPIAAQREKKGAAKPGAGFFLKIAVLFLAVAALGAGGYFFWQNYMGVASTAEFDIKAANPSSLCYYNDNLWITDWVAGQISKFGIKEEAAYPSQELPGGIQPAGVATDGKKAWISDSFESKIHVLEMSPVYAVKTSYASPGTNPSGLYFDGKNLWSLDFQASKAYRHNMDEKLSVAAEFDCPVKNPRCMFGEKDSFFILGALSNKLYKVRQSDFMLEGIYEVPKSEKYTSAITSITFDGKCIWVAYQGVSKVTRYCMKKLNKVNI
ncbi:MAG: response regulator [Elusimicrobiota bacterium]